MALEGETDALMRRTRGRPVAAGRVPRGDALTYGVILSVASVTLLGLGVNWLAGGLLALTIVYYAGLYTLAVGTGASRVINDRHWLSDVVGGALLGTAIAKVVDGRWRIFNLRPPELLTGPQGTGLRWRLDLPALRTAPGAPN